MRALLFAILCIFTIGYIAADDCITMGERQEGDYASQNRTIFKPPIPWKIMIATIGVTPPLGEIITHIKITNIGDKKATCTVIENSDPDTSKITILVEGKRGEGLLVGVEAYAIKVETTTEAPTTTTTETPISTTPTTERPTTTERPAPTTTTTERPVPTTITTERPTTTERPAPTTTTTERPESTTPTTERPAPTTTTTKRPVPTTTTTQVPTTIGTTTTEDPTTGTTTTEDPTTGTTIYFD